MPQKIFNLVFWLGLSLAFGGTVALAVVGSTLFPAARKAQISMPGVATPPLDPANQAGGEIFGAILNSFGRLEAFALFLIFVPIAGWIVTSRSVRRSTWFIAGLWGFVTLLAFYDGFSLRPEVWQLRQTVRDQAAAHANDTSDPWPERARFDTLHHRSETLGKFKAFSLLAMLVTAAWRGPGESRRYRGSLQDAMRVSRR